MTNYHDEALGTDCPCDICEELAEVHNIAMQGEEVREHLLALDVADQLVRVATYGAAMIDLATVEADAEKRHAQILEVLPE